ncbi:MAG: hypothetical protein ACK5H2_04305 [Beutenbergiaceae bacterium]
MISMDVAWSAIIVVVALTASAGLGAPLVSWVLRRSTGQSTPSPDVLRGGTWIGVLERVATTGALLVGYPAGIAIVIAIKGLGRFPELKGASGASERFIIGTLTSVLWAGAFGIAGRALILLLHT